MSICNPRAIVKARSSGAWGQTGNVIGCTCSTRGLTHNKGVFTWVIRLTHAHILFLQCCFYPEIRKKSPIELTKPDVWQRADDGAEFLHMGKCSRLLRTFISIVTLILLKEKEKGDEEFYEFLYEVKY